MGLLVSSLRNVIFVLEPSPPIQAISKENKILTGVKSSGFYKSKKVADYLRFPSIPCKFVLLALSSFKFNLFRFCLCVTKIIFFIGLFTCISGAPVSRAAVSRWYGAPRPLGRQDPWERRQSNQNPPCHAIPSIPSGACSEILNKGKCF